MLEVDKDSEPHGEACALESEAEEMELSDDGGCISLLGLPRPDS